RPGLKAFHSGAFGAAWRGSLPILPVVVLGARQKLPSGALLPRPGPLEVRICAAIASETFESTKALMQQTRAAMLEQLGEPDLALARPGKPDLAEARAPENAPDRGSAEDGLAPPAAHICE